MNEDTIKSVAYRLRQDENRKIACPACVDAGKDKHDLSMSVINKGDYALYKCHRDDSHNGRINFEGRKRTEPPAEKPTEKIDPSEKELSAGQRWIEQVRGIPFERVEQFVSFGSAYFKQANGSLPCIEFIYKDENGKKVYSKFRSIEGKYFTSGHSTPGGTDTLYLTEAVNYEKPYLIITEGECLTGDTEVLTPSGWVKIEEVLSGDIAQWSADGQIKFVRPLAKIEKDYEGQILNFKNNSVSCAVTPLHRMPGIFNGELRFRSAAERASGSYRHEQMPRAGILDGPGIPLSDSQISFCLAISADASIDIRKCNPAVKTGARAKESRYARISFKKTRKIERFESLLLSLGLDYTKTVQPSRPDMTFFGVSLPEWVPGRELPWDWISNATIRQRKFILEELIEWDGNRVPNRTQTEYSSKYDSNAQFVQTLCHTSGICSSVIKRKSPHGSWNKVSILNGKSYSTYQQFKSESKNFVGKVYCFTVPSGMFLVRHNGKISVTGNCDALTLKAAGFNAVSMPTGANVKWLVHNQNLLSKFQRVLIWFDADAKGGTVAEKLKLQPPKLTKNFAFLNPKKLAELCPNSKDANEVLLAHGTGLFKQILATCFEKHTPDYVIRPSSLMKGLVRVRDNTYANRVGINSPALDEVISLVRGYAGLVTGIPGHGKSTFLSWYAYKRAEIYGHKTVFWSPENDPTLLTADIIGMAAGRLVKGHAGALPMSDHELQTHAAFADTHFRVVQDCEEGSDIETILNQMQAAALDMGGADLYVIDPWNYIKMPNVASKNSLDAVRMVYSRIRRFAVANDCSVVVVAHPKKMDEIEAKKRDDEDDASRSESHEENGIKRYKMPGMYSISGSADFANMADFVIVVHREESHTTIANVKSRRPFLGTMGASCAVAYRPSAGDFRILSGARFDASGWREPDGAPF